MLTCPLHWPRAGTHRQALAKLAAQFFQADIALADDLRNSQEARLACRRWTLSDDMAMDTASKISRVACPCRLVPLVAAVRLV